MDCKCAKQCYERGYRYIMTCILVESVWFEQWGDKGTIDRTVWALGFLILDVLFSQNPSPDSTSPISNKLQKSTCPWNLQHLMNCKYETILHQGWLWSHLGSDSPSRFPGSRSLQGKAWWGQMQPRSLGKAKGEVWREQPRQMVVFRWSLDLSLPVPANLAFKSRNSDLCWVSCHKTI